MTTAADRAAAPAAPSPDLEALLAAERERLKQLFPLPAARVPRASARRKAAGGAAALGILLACAALVVDPQWGRETQASAVGEQRHLTLADGSQVQLDSGAQVTVSRHLRTRQGTLDKGRARFKVVPSAWRSFTVDAGIARVRVMGTVFDVDRQVGRVEVTVLSGKENVGSPDRPDAVAPLRAGERLRVVEEGGGARRFQALPADRDGDRQAWSQGQLVFHGAPLSEVVADLQRYRAGEIRLADAGLGELRVSGVFDTARVDTAIALLPRILPVVIRHEPGGRAVIAARPAAEKKSP